MRNTLIGIALCLLLQNCSVFVSSAYAQTPSLELLKGSVSEESEAETRIHSFGQNADVGVATDRPSTRIHRLSNSSDSEHTFGGSLTSQTAKRAALSANDTANKPTSQFDLETEANSRVLSLAWDRWHKQLSRSLYERSRPRASGVCVFVVTVSREQHVTVQILDSAGSSLVTENVVQTVMSLEGDPGLVFPFGSKRQIMHDSLFYTSGRSVSGGYDWVRDNVENVRQDY